MNSETWIVHLARQSYFVSWYEEFWTWALSSSSRIIGPKTSKPRSCALRCFPLISVSLISVSRVVMPEEHVVFHWWRAWCRRRQSDWGWPPGTAWAVEAHHDQWRWWELASKCFGGKKSKVLLIRFYSLPIDYIAFLWTSYQMCIDIYAVCIRRYTADRYTADIPAITYVRAFI